MDLRDQRPVRRIVPHSDAPTGTRTWPTSVPAVRQLLDDGLELAPGVTLLVGENGSGKSTLVEAVAMAFGLSAEGGSVHSRHGTYETESDLWRWLRLERAPGAPRWGPASSRSASGGSGPRRTTTWSWSTTGGATSTSR